MLAKQHCPAKQARHLTRLIMRVRLLAAVMLFNVLAPTLVHSAATSARQDGAPIAICTAAGVRLVRLDFAFVDTEAPTDATASWPAGAERGRGNPGIDPGIDPGSLPVDMALSSPHCPLCLVGETPGLPLAYGSSIGVAPLSAVAIPSVDRVWAKRPAWRAELARGPPGRQARIPGIDRI